MKHDTGEVRRRPTRFGKWAAGNFPRFLGAWSGIAMLSPGLLLCGACRMFFQPIRTARFIDMDTRTIQVEYGEEVHDDILEDGRTFSFKGKIRLTLPDGKRVYLYQGLTPVGILYHSKKKDYSFLEEGIYCFLSHDGKLIFEGVYCRDSPAQKKKGGKR